MTLKPWNVLRSTRIVDDDWIHLRADYCARSNGATLGPYYVMENPDWVSVFGLTPDRQVVLISEYHHGAGIVGKGLPGGAANDQDESMSTVAARELSEETGYAAGELISLGSAYSNWGNQTNRIHFFLALECRLEGPQQLDENEEIETSRVPVVDFQPAALHQAFHLTNALLALDYVRQYDL